MQKAHRHVFYRLTSDSGRSWPLLMTNLWTRCHPDLVALDPQRLQRQRPRIRWPAQSAVSFLTRRSFASRAIKATLSVLLFQKKKGETKKWVETRRRSGRQGNDVVHLLRERDFKVDLVGGPTREKSQGFSYQRKRACG